MTNFERIKAMSVEEMARCIEIKVKQPCEFCIYFETVKKYDVGCPYCYEDDVGCEYGIKNWLELGCKSE